MKPLIISNKMDERFCDHVADHREFAQFKQDSTDLQFKTLYENTGNYAATIEDRTTAGW